MRLAMTIAVVLSSVASAAPKAKPEAVLVKAVAAFKEQIRIAPSLDEKLTALGRTKEYLRTEAEKLTSSDRAQRRKLRFTVVGLREYFDLLGESEIRAGRCESVRENIHFAVDPKRDKPEHMPGEAVEALAFLDLLCVSR